MKKGKACVPTDDERKRLSLITRTGPDAHRNVAILAFSYRLGLRAKELASLTIRDVIDERGVPRPELVLKHWQTKGGKARTVYLSNKTVKQDITLYLNGRHLVEDVAFNLDAALFKSRKGNHFSPNTMQQLLARLHARAGIQGGSSHSGRRWFATELIAKGVDLKAVSVLMGHSSVSMTAQYAEDNPQRLRRISAELS
jgi:integrase/recombinase XerD